MRLEPSAFPILAAPPSQAAPVDCGQVPTVAVYRGITETTEHGSVEGYITHATQEPNLGNWLEREGVADPQAARARIQAPVVAVLKNMYVEGDARGNGEGNALMEQFLATADALGAASVVLLADTQDDQNGSGFDLVAWYEGWGFTTVAQTGGGPLMVLNN
jgi:GNAT superfamily N-acetyltransferase